MTNIELINAIISKVENRAKINDEFENNSKGKPNYTMLGQAMRFH